MNASLGHPSRRRQHPSTVDLVVENLESRLTPSTFTVLDSNDALQMPANIGTNNPMDTNNSTSLRSAIAAANVDAANGISDTINFASSLNGATITLTHAQLELKAGSGTTMIDGGGQITVSGNNAFTVLEVDCGAKVIVTGLTVTAGNGSIFNRGFQATLGGGIYNSGTLTVNSSTLFGNLAGVCGVGGGIYNDGTLTVISSTLSGNSSDEEGGGIYNSGTLTVKSSTLSGSSVFCQGAGIYNSGTLTVTSSTLSGNSSDEEGGGIYNSGTLTVNSSTISANYSSSGAGICNTREH